MPKGFFTQSAFLLMEGPVSPEALQSALEGCSIRGSLSFDVKDAAGQPVEKATMLAGKDVLVIDLPKDPRGALLVDQLPIAWPDDFGDPEKTPELSEVFAMGQFGPFPFPGCLERACDMGGAEHRGLAHVREQHKALVRLRTSWALGEELKERVVPEDYDPSVELRFLADIAANLLEELPGALCFFNPNGEVIASLSEMEQALAHADENGQPPLELFANVRFIEIEDFPRLGLVDTIGMWQLDVPDQEAVFTKTDYDPREVAIFLRHASFVQMKGHAFADGEQAGGPPRGHRPWRALAERLAFVAMPRPVVRWIALDGSEDKLPKAVLEKPDLAKLMAGDEAPGGDAEPKP